MTPTPTPGAHTMTDQHWTRTGGNTWRVEIGPRSTPLGEVLANLARQAPGDPLRERLAAQQAAHNQAALDWLVAEGNRRSSLFNSAVARFLP